jgi:hypothetical protein
VTAADIAIEKQAGADRAVATLGITQMIGWGTTYYVPAVLTEQFQRDLGLDASRVFSGIAVMLITAAGLPAGVLFITLFSFGAGLMAVALATLPLWLLGAQGYAVTIGRLTVPTQMIYAVSPMTYGLFLNRFGLAATLWISLASSLTACAALITLSRLLRAR